MPKPTSVEAGVRFDLESLVRDMRRDDGYQRNGQLARTLVRTPHLRIVLLVMAAGNQIPEHSAEETTSIHVLSGGIRLRLPDKAVELSSGQLLVLESGLTHDVEATSDSAFLLTIGWPGQR